MVDIVALVNEVTVILAILIGDEKIVNEQVTVEATLETAVLVKVDTNV